MQHASAAAKNVRGLVDTALARLGEAPRAGAPAQSATIAVRDAAKAERDWQARTSGQNYWVNDLALDDDLELLLGKLTNALERIRALA